MEGNILNINSFGKSVLRYMKAYPDATAKDILMSGVGKTEIEISFVMTQLKLFGFV